MMYRRAGRAHHREQQYEALLAAGRTSWIPGERVRYFRDSGGEPVWLPDEVDEAHQAQDRAQRQDYDVEHYLQVLVSSCASRLRKAFTPEDFEQLFRLDTQLSLFDKPVEQMEPIGIRCAGQEPDGAAPG